MRFALALFALAGCAGPCHPECPASSIPLDWVADDTAPELPEGWHAHADPVLEKGSDGLLLFAQGQPAWLLTNIGVPHPHAKTDSCGCTTFDYTGLGLWTTAPVPSGNTVSADIGDDGTVAVSFTLDGESGALTYAARDGIPEGF